MAIRHKIILLTQFILILTSVVQSKVYERYELAKLLYDNGITDITRWMCMTQFLSNFNTSTHIPGDIKSGHGLFRIYYPFWCGIGENSGKCNIDCEKLRDEDISDDIQCVKIILEKQGIEAWKEPYARCKDNEDNSVPDWIFAYNKDIDMAKACPPQREF